MKKFIFQVMAFLAFAGLQSCIINLDNGIDGNGNVVSETRTVEDFDGIDAAAGLQVFVSFGEMSNEIEVEADDNLHEYIVTRVENGVLKIKTTRNIHHAEEKNVYVRAGKVNMLEASSAARMICENLLKAEDLEIDVSSAGSLELNTEAGRIDIDISSAGNAELSGSAEWLYVGASSGATLKAYELKTVNCDVNASSAANVRVFVTAKLRADASSAANVRYRGNPESRDISKSSAGNVGGE